MTPASNRKTSKGHTQTRARLVWSGKVLGALLLMVGLMIGSADNHLSAGAAPKTKPPKGAKLDKALKAIADSDNNGTVPVIVTYKPGAGARVEEKLAKHGKKVKQHLGDLRNVVTELKAEDFEAMTGDDDFEAFSLDAEVTSFAASYSLRSTLNLTTGTDKDVKAGPQGTGVTVAVIDSGIDKTIDIGPRADNFFTFTNGVAKKVGPFDDFGHGSHVAGLIGGDGNKSKALGFAYRGVAAGVKYVGLKVLDGNGAGTTSDVLAAIEFAIANKDKYSIDVINLSLGHPILEPAATDPLVQAVEAAVRAGIVVVCSAGNIGMNPETGEIGYAGITSPGNAPSCITVGASDTLDTTKRSDDRIAPYSSRGPSWIDGYAKPDLVAPGTALTSIGDARGFLYKNYGQYRVAVGKEIPYLQLSGTSMSAGVVSGAVALLLEANPALTPNTVKAILQFTALPVVDDNGQPYDVLTQGAGALNLEGALRLAKAVNTNAPVGSWWLTAGVTPSTTTDGETLAWSQVVIWGSDIASGDGIYYNRSAWANNVVWGDNIVWGGVRAKTILAENIVWANNIVGGGIRAHWAENLVYGNNIVWGARLKASSLIDGLNIVWGGARRK